MEQEAVLLEAITLAEEILDRGSQDGRGMRLAALVLKLNAAMEHGHIPISWRPTAPPTGSSMYPSVAKIPGPPRLPWEAGMLQAIPDPEELDQAWDALFSDHPPAMPSSFPKAEPRITTSPKPRITLAPPEEQDAEEQDDIIELSNDDVELCD